MVKPRKWIATLGCLLMFFASGYGLLNELDPFLARPVADIRVADDFRQRDFDFGLSSYSKILVLTDCFRVVRIYGASDMMDEAVRNVVTRCADQADDIVSTTPTDSFAWLVHAAASALLLDNENFNISLQKSQLTGPNEQWIARFRVNLAESNVSKLTPRTRQMEDADLGLLASSARGVKLIARRYISDPAFRARITAIVEKLPQDKQVIFLRTVKQSMNSAG